MNKIEIRKKRVQLKAERIAILRKIDELQSALDSQKDRKKRREIRLEIQKLGKLLESKVLYNISDHEFADSSNDYRDYATGKKKLGRCLLKNISCIKNVDGWIKTSGKQKVYPSINYGIGKERTVLPVKCGCKRLIK